MTIKVFASISATLSEELDDWGPVGLPLSEPPCRLRGKKGAIGGRPDARIGIWECTPGKFRREIKAGEMMHILSGECTFTPDSGEAPVHMKAGDTVFLPADTIGIWDIKSTLRKVYALF